MSPLYAAVWLPRFQLQVALRGLGLPMTAEVVVLDGSFSSALDAERKGRILQASVTAESLGIGAGMTPSQAQARCPKLRVLHRVAAGEERAQQELLQAALQWTPDYESTAPGLCLLEFTRVRGLWQRREACGRQLHEWLAGRELEARIGFASNPELAGLAAQAARPVLIVGEEAGAEAQLLSDLPISALGPTAPLAQLLRLWGVRTLGQFARLPRAEVARRLGNEGLLLWDMAAGGRDRLLRRVRPASGYREEMELEHAVESLEPLLFVLRRMLENLCERLAGDWLVASALALELRFQDQTSHQRTLRVAEPTRDVGLLLRVIYTHLENLTTTAPILAVVLELTPTRPAQQQTALFERTLRDPNRFAETLAQLEALVGQGNVGKARLLPSRRPNAFTLVNFLAPAAPGLLPEERPAHGLPLRCFRPSRQVTVLLRRGQPATLQTGGQTLTITQARGPWLLSGDWWDHAPWQREIWEIAASDGALYQLAKEGSRWVLDGVFG